MSEGIPWGKIFRAGGGGGGGVLLSRGELFRGNCSGVAVFGGIIQEQLSREQKSGEKLSWGEFNGVQLSGGNLPGGNVRIPSMSMPRSIYVVST